MRRISVGRLVRYTYIAKLLHILLSSKSPRKWNTGYCVRY